MKPYIKRLGDEQIAIWRAQAQLSETMRGIKHWTDRAGKLTGQEAKREAWENATKHAVQGITFAVESLDGPFRKSEQQREVGQ